jgi:hypothetical protein
MSEIPAKVWTIGKARPLAARQVPIRSSETEGLAPLTVLDRDGERALPVFTARYKAERGIKHFMTEEDRANGPIASAFVALEDLPRRIDLHRRTLPRYPDSLRPGRGGIIAVETDSW